MLVLDFLLARPMLRRAALRLILTHARVTGRLSLLLEDWVLVARLRELCDQRHFSWQIGDIHYDYVGTDPASFCAKYGLPMPD